MRTSFGTDLFGNTYEYDIITGERFYENDQTGDGIIDTIKSIGKKVASKLTGKATKDIAQKVVTKAVEKGAEQFGNKTGEIIANKINNVCNKPDSTAENKGDRIIEILKTHPSNKEYQQEDKKVLKIIMI